MLEEQIKEAANTAIDAALAKVPELKALLDGEPVELVITLQLRKPVKP